LREWHLTATTPTKQKEVEFIGVYRPYRHDDAIPGACDVRQVIGGYVLTGRVGADQIVMLLPENDAATVSFQELKTTGKIVIQDRHAGGETQTLILGKDE